MIIDNINRVLKKPRLSVILVVFRMPEQAKKTLYSLSASYQKNVSCFDYEVIVIENNSDQLLGKQETLQFGTNFKYHFREEKLKSPVNAINFGVQKTRGSIIGIMIDGARMLSPGVIENVLSAFRITKNALVSVPGYHLGIEVQQKAIKSGYDEIMEAKLLNSINWPENGYRLFEISCFSGTSAHGFFNPIAESNCFCIPKHLFLSSGGCDSGFDMPGGGFINLDIYKRFCELPNTKLFILPGEGTFHQFHNGVTTGKCKEKTEPLIEELRQQYISIRGEKYAPPQKKAIYLGAIPDSAQQFVKFSSEKILERTINL